MDLLAWYEVVHSGEETRRGERLNLVTHVAALRIGNNREFVRHETLERGVREDGTVPNQDEDGNPKGCSPEPLELPEFPSPESVQAMRPSDPVSRHTPCPLLGLTPTARAACARLGPTPVRTPLQLESGRPIHCAERTRFARKRRHFRFRYSGSR